MFKSRRDLLAGTGVFAAASFLAGTAQAGIFRRRNQCYCPLPAPGTNIGAIERGLDANAGRPGKGNPGEKSLNEQDNRRPGQRALSLHLGVNWVNEDHYGRITQLNGCLYDVQRMRAIAQGYGFVSSSLTNTHATTANFLSYLNRQAEKLVDGDMLLISYSGHGSNIDDSSGDELDLLDETWCLHDRMLLDDEVWYSFSKFQPNVRILFILDSCHSGTAIKSMGRARSLRSANKETYRSTFGPDTTSLDRALDYLEGTDPLSEEETRALQIRELAFATQPRIRTLRASEAGFIYAKNQALYDKVQKDLPNQATLKISASSLLLAACQDGQVAQEIGSSGLFTRSISTVLGNRPDQGVLFDGTYDAFLTAVKDQMRGGTRQTPELFKDGDLTTLFRNERPFDRERRQPPSVV